MSIAAVSRRAQEITPFLVMDILERAQELERQGAHVIHLEVGQPDWDTRPTRVAGPTSGHVKTGRCCAGYRRDKSPGRTDAHFIQSDVVPPFDVQAGQSSASVRS